MKTFLTNLGFSAYETEKLVSFFGSPEQVVSLLASAEGRKELAGVTDPSSVALAHSALTRSWYAKTLHQYLKQFGVPQEYIYRFYLCCGEDEDSCMNILKTDPYRLVFDAHVPFPLADKVASDSGMTSERTKAAVYSALLLAENGSEDAALNEDISEFAGSTCLPADKLITTAEHLLGDGAADEIISAAKHLHFEKKILLTKKVINGEKLLVAIRPELALAEFGSAERIRKLLSKGTVSYSQNVYESIDTAQQSLGLYLSHEQADAVHQALTNHISVITGGPGTGKTQTQKVLLESYRILSGNSPVQLMAPTGKAAQRIKTATGYPASTIHKALGIFPGETDPEKAFDIRADLIIIDEASMLDAQLFHMLLMHLQGDAILVIEGDVDQLPSIGAGNTLAELIKCVPVTRLTKIFRQDGDAADIAHNAARIREGENRMIESERFTFIKASGSSNIRKAVCELYRKEAESCGIENVIVLTPLRRKTKTGVNQLNQVLRKTCSDSKKYISFGKNRIYLNDKVMFLKNRYGLSNGSIGFVTKISRDSAECSFGEKKITLSGSQLQWITPAYAETIHRSQGDEHKTVIVIADKCHPATKALMYTACTRAKEKLIIVGEPSAFKAACQKDGGLRYSLLSGLVNEGEA